MNNTLWSKDETQKLEEEREQAREANRRSYQKHKAERLEHQRIYREQNREVCRARVRRWTEKHLEEENRRKAEYRANNREKLREQQREIYRRNPAAYTAKCRNRRARILGNGGKITADEWGALKEKYHNRCVFPGCERTDVTMDHVVPLSMGGEHVIENIQPLCEFHNRSKFTKSVDYRHE